MAPFVSKLLDHTIDEFVRLMRMHDPSDITEEDFGWHVVFKAGTFVRLTTDAISAIDNFVDECVDPSAQTDSTSRTKYGELFKKQFGERAGEVAYKACTMLVGDGNIGDSRPGAVPFAPIKSPDIDALGLGDIYKDCGEWFMYAVLFDGKSPLVMSINLQPTSVTLPYIEGVMGVVDNIDSAPGDFTERVACDFGRSSRNLDLLIPEIHAIITPKYEVLRV